MHVVVVGGGSSALDLNDLRADLVLGVQKAARRYPELVPRFTHFFLNSDSAGHYVPLLLPRIQCVCTWKYSRRGHRAVSPSWVVVHRPKNYGTGPESVLWAASQPGVERVTICGFDPTEEPKFYDTQQQYWPAVRDEIDVPVFESENCSLGCWQKAGLDNAAIHS